MNRRAFLAAAGSGVVAIGGATSAAGQQPPAAPGPGAGAPGSGGPVAAKFQIGMVIFEKMTNLDFVGPCDVLSRVSAAHVNVIAKTRDPITTDSNHRVLADMTLAEAPALDLLFIPGGPGSTALMDDPEIMEFLHIRAPRAKWITSVCTGGLVLGAAGLLKGYKAATHWTAMDILPIMGAIPTHQRVVIDRNRITGGGVTAGIDFGLTVVATLWGAEMAQMIQLGQEYNPQPPFNAGAPDTAPPALVEHFRSMWSRQTAERTAAARRAAARMG